MQTKVVEYYEDVEGGDPVAIKLTVGRATVMMGMRRAVLQGSAEAWVAERRAAVLDAKGEADDGDAVGETVSVSDVDGANGHRPELLNLMAGSLAARILYPDLVACVVDADGLDTDALTVDQFLELPDQLTTAWETAVYALNAHWLPAGRSGPVDDEAAEKKG